MSKCCCQTKLSPQIAKSLSASLLQNKWYIINQNIKWLHKPSAFYSDEELLHDDLLHLLVCLYQPLLGVGLGYIVMIIPEIFKHTLRWLIQRWRSRLTSVFFNIWSVKFAVLSMEELAKYSSASFLFCRGFTHCQQTPPTHLQGHIRDLTIISFNCNLFPQWFLTLLDNFPQSCSRCSMWMEQDRRWLWGCQVESGVEISDSIPWKHISFWMIIIISILTSWPHSCFW